jgi:hypothetical protein
MLISLHVRRRRYRVEVEWTFDFYNTPFESIMAYQRMRGRKEGGFKIPSEDFVYGALGDEREWHPCF